MRSDVMKWAGGAGLVFGVALVVQLVTARISGADVYNERYAATLVAIVDHRTAFTISAGSGAIAVACLIPMAMGIFFSFEDEYRPGAALCGLFMVTSAILSLVAYSFYGNLVGTAVDYSRTVSNAAGIVQNADILGDQFEIVQYAGLVSFGASLLVLGHLILKTETFPRVLGWLSVGVGASTVLFNVFPTLVIVGRLSVAFGLGYALWSGSRQEPELEAEPAVA